MHRCTILVACVLLGIILFGTTKTWFSRVRRDGGEVEGGVKKDGICPEPTDPVFNSTVGVSPCPKSCRISLSDYDCLDAKKCCPTPCNGNSHMCINPKIDIMTQATTAATTTTKVTTTSEATTTATVKTAANIPTTNQNKQHGNEKGKG